MSTSIEVRTKKRIGEGWLLGKMVAFLAGALMSTSVLAVEIGETAPSFTIESLNSDETVSLGDFKGKVVILDFWASWCGPCRSFTPKLIDFKNKHADNFEVVLIGSDGSAKAQKNYIKKYKMPWLALINQSAAAREISSQLEVEFIPYLVVLNQDGKVLTKNGKNDVVRLGEKAFSFWQQIEEN